MHRDDSDAISQSLAIRQSLAAALGDSYGGRDQRTVQIYTSALQRWWDRMAEIMGTGGAQAILGRAIRLTSTSCTAASSVALDVEGHELSKVLSLRSIDPAEAAVCLEEICVAVLGTLQELVGNLLTEPILNELRSVSTENGNGAKHGAPDGNT